MMDGMDYEYEVPWLRGDDAVERDRVIREAFPYADGYTSRLLGIDWLRVLIDAGKADAGKTRMDKLDGPADAPVSIRMYELLGGYAEHSAWAGDDVDFPVGPEWFGWSWDNTFTLNTMIRGQRKVLDAFHEAVRNHGCYRDTGENESGFWENRNLYVAANALAMVMFIASIGDLHLGNATDDGHGVWETTGLFSHEWLYSDEYPSSTGHASKYCGDIDSWNGPVIVDNIIDGIRDEIIRWMLDAIQHATMPDMNELYRHMPPFIILTAGDSDGCEEFYNVDFHHSSVLPHHIVLTDPPENSTIGTMLTPPMHTNEGTSMPMSIMGIADNESYDTIAYYLNDDAQFDDNGYGIGDNEVLDRDSWTSVTNPPSRVISVFDPVLLERIGYAGGPRQLVMDAYHAPFNVLAAARMIAPAFALHRLLYTYDFNEVVYATMVDRGHSRATEDKQENSLYYDQVYDYDEYMAMLDKYGVATGIIMGDNHKQYGLMLPLADTITLLTMMASWYLSDRLMYDTELEQYCQYSCLLCEQAYPFMITMLLEWLTGEHGNNDSTGITPRLDRIIQILRDMFNEAWWTTTRCMLNHTGTAPTRTRLERFTTTLTGIMDTEQSSPEPVFIEEYHDTFPELTTFLDQ